MARTLSDPAVESLMGEDTDEVWLALVTIDHEDLEEPIRVVNNVVDIESNGETFIGCPFDLELLSETPDGPGVATLSIDNVDKQIIEAVRSIQGPPSVTTQVILASDPDTIELEVGDLTMRNVTADVAKVQGTLELEDLTVEPCSETITPHRFPGMF